MSARSLQILAQRGNHPSKPSTRTCPWFDASAKPENWGIIGWSIGGACAVDLTVMHPPWMVMHGCALSLIGSFSGYE